MRVIIGSGLAGLLLNHKISADLILEEQPTIGGIYSSDKIFEIELPYVCPILAKPLTNFDFKYKEYDLSVYHRKIEYLKEKICPYCEALPYWITFDNIKKLYIISNITQFVSELSKNSKIIKEYPIKIDKNMIITNKGNILKYQILYNTGSLKRLYKLLGISNDSLGFVSAISLLLIGKSKNKKDEWNVYLSGDRADSFSTIIKLNNFIADFTIYYVYSFTDLNKSKIDIDRILLDLKRRRIVDINDIIAYRAKFISEAILFGSSMKEIQNNIINCGRLGDWRNYSIEETIEKVQNC
ncbi:MAG: hypothetical protein QXQ01_01390 [Saccharolobus sp.]